MRCRCTYGAAEWCGACVDGFAELAGERAVAWFCAYLAMAEWCRQRERERPRRELDDWYRKSSYLDGIIVADVDHMEGED